MLHKIIQSAIIPILILSVSFVTSCSNTSDSTTENTNSDRTDVGANVDTTTVNAVTTGNTSPAVSDQLCYKWNFDFIKNEAGEEVKPITDGDFMEIKTDNSFYYILNEAEVEASGSWKLSEDEKSIIYTYTPKEGQADTVVRTYQLAKITEDQLHFFEKGITYGFRR